MLRRIVPVFFVFLLVVVAGAVAARPSQDVEPEHSSLFPIVFGGDAEDTPAPRPTSTAPTSTPIVFPTTDVSPFTIGGTNVPRPTSTPPPFPTIEPTAVPSPYP